MLVEHFMFLQTSHLLSPTMSKRLTELTWMGTPVVFSSVSAAFTSGNSSTIDIRSGDQLGPRHPGVNRGRWSTGDHRGIVWSGNDASVCLGAGQQVYVDGAVFCFGSPGSSRWKLRVMTMMVSAFWFPRGLAYPRAVKPVTVLPVRSRSRQTATWKSWAMWWVAERFRKRSTQTATWKVKPSTASDSGGTVTITATGQAYIGGTTVNQSGAKVKTGGYLSAADLIDVTGTSHSSGTATLVHAASELVSRDTDSRINVTGTAGDVESTRYCATGWRNHQGL